MNARRQRAAAGLALSLLAAPATAQDNPLGLTIDPFVKPALAAPAPVIPETYGAETATLEEQTTVPELPRLRAILHSARSTLVNLDGALVPVGGTHLGYHIAAAGARDVVLHANDTTYVVSIDSEEKSDVRLR